MVMRRILTPVAVLLLLGLALALAGGPLLLGAAMLSPALVLALALRGDRYPGVAHLERWRDRRARPAPRHSTAAGLGWQRFRRPAAFRPACGPLLGLAVAVRPPPA